MTAPEIDPVQLASYLDGNASELLSEYFRSGRFTGGSFERFAGGGDRPDVADRFTSDDIVAVSLLGVRIPGLPALSILGDREAEFSQMLAGIPAGVDLWEAEEAAVGPGSAADRLWRALVALPGIGWVTAGKLLARKRPRLIPVYDRVVLSAFGRDGTEDWWRPLRAVLAGNPDTVAALGRLRAESGIGDDVSLLRVLDVCVWMRERGEPEPVPDAEG